MTSARSTTAAVVVPLYRERLNATDAMALTQCCRVLGRHPVVFAVPESMAIGDATRLARNEGVEPRVERFRPDYFRSPGTYNALLLSRGFFERFAAYDYILIHQLDAFVFSDELMRFCTLGYDYIGAPWLGLPPAMRRVGNGGFSLRRVEAALRVLRSAPSPRLALWWWQRDRLQRALGGTADRWGLTRTAMQSRRYVPLFAAHLLYVNEDGFWGQNCSKLPFYTTAPVEIALRFSFETDVWSAYETNGKALPFGCHAWPDRHQDFWAPHIRRCGYEWNGGSRAAQAPVLT